jgi:DNA polymerase-3 subunit alpha
MFEATDSPTVRYGLGAVKGVGRGACEAISAARTNAGGDFQADLLDFCKRVDAPSSTGARWKRWSCRRAGCAGRNRASLMLQLPEVLKATDQIARNRDAGIVDMFGNATGAPDIHIDLPTCGEWPLAQKLQGERETLGHYLSGHPMDPHRDELQRLVGHDLSSLDALWEARPQEARRGWRQQMQAVVAGQVVGMRKRGDSQAFVQLEDGRGRIECAFFGDEWKEYAPLLTRDRILVVEGDLREDEFSGGFALRASRCWDFTQLCGERAQRVSIRIDLRQPDALQHFERMLQAHAGATPLLIEAITAAGIGRLTVNGGRGLRVDAALPGLLRNLPGVDAVSVTLAKPWVN